MGLDPAMVQKGYSKTYESLDKVVVIASLITVALFLRRNQPPKEPSESPIRQAGSTVGMDELWKDAMAAQKSGLSYLPHIPPPPAEPPAPKVKLVQAKAPPPAEEVEPEYEPPPRPAPPRPARKLKPMGFSFGSEGSGSASSSAFYSSPKAPPAPRQQLEAQAAQTPAAPARPGKPAERGWRKFSSH